MRDKRHVSGEHLEVLIQAKLSGQPAQTRPVAHATVRCGAFTGAAAGTVPNLVWYVWKLRSRVGPVQSLSISIPKISTCMLLQLRHPQKSLGLPGLHTWGGEILLARGFERVGRRSEYSVYNVWRCVRRGAGASSEPPELLSLAPGSRRSPS